MSRKPALTTPERGPNIALADVTRQACDELAHIVPAVSDAEAIVRNFKLQLLNAALAETGGNMCGAARLLRVHRNTVSRWRDMA